MRIRVLGAAAGGGFPQWNVGSDACRRARAGDPSARSATQASIAVSADDGRWALINASPDLRQQIEATPALHPPLDGRGSPISTVVLTNADVDAIAGLLHLREGTPFSLYAHPRVLGVLNANPVFEVVNRNVVPRRRLLVDEWQRPADAAGGPLGWSMRPFLAPGKLPLYLETREIPDTAALVGDTLGLEIESGGCRVVYLANCAALTDDVRVRAGRADLLFMDGTLWRDDEMIAQGSGTKTARRMGHVAMSDVIDALADLAVDRRVFIHVNNTNPALLADSPERAALERAGWEVAFDGMELSL